MSTNLGIQTRKNLFRFFCPSPSLIFPRMSSTPQWWVSGGQGPLSDECLCLGRRKSDICQSSEVMADSGQADVKWCLIIGDGGNLELQRRPRCDLALLFVNYKFLEEQKFSVSQNKTISAFFKTPLKWLSVCSWRDIMLQNLSAEEMKRPFLVVFSPTAPRTRASHMNFIR